VCVDRKGYVYANSQNNPYKVVKLTPDGALVWEYALTNGYDVVVDNNQYVYISDYKDGVLKLNPEGKMIWRYSLPGVYGVAVDNKGYVYVSGVSKAIKIQDNTTVAKVAVLKEREV